MSQRDPALDHGGRLARFLDRTIRELKPVDEFQPVRTEPPKVTPAMPAKPLVNKFTELAAKLKANQAVMHKEADALSAEADDVMPQFMEAVGKHRSILQSAKAGVKDMQDAANILSNFDPNE